MQALFSCSGQVLYDQRQIEWPVYTVDSAVWYYCHHPNCLFELNCCHPYLQSGGAIVSLCSWAGPYVLCAHFRFHWETQNTIEKSASCQNVTDLLQHCQIQFFLFPPCFFRIKVYFLFKLNINSMIVWAFGGEYEEFYYQPFLPISTTAGCFSYYIWCRRALQESNLSIL